MKRQNPFVIVAKTIWTLILVLFMALTIYVSVNNGLYENTYNDLTQQEQSVENEEELPEDETTNDEGVEGTTPSDDETVAEGE